VLLLLGMAAGTAGFLTFGTARLAIDKVETLLLFLIAAVLITGGAVVRAVDRSSRIMELQAAIRGGGAVRVRPDPTGDDDDAFPVEDGWPEDGPRRRRRRLVNFAGAAFLAVALSLAALWLVVPHVR